MRMAFGFRIIQGKRPFFGMLSKTDWAFPLRSPCFSILNIQLLLEIILKLLVPHSTGMKLTL
jgi:hypothetical protein